MSSDVRQTAEFYAQKRKSKTQETALGIVLGFDTSG
jgi:hypothetical protein